jgi:hypothetical protein
MYKDILLTALRGITLPTDQMIISENLSAALTQAGHPDILCLGIFNGGESLFEGVVMDGVNMQLGPLLRFTYDWDTDEFTEL